MLERGRCYGDPVSSESTQSCWRRSWRTESPLLAVLLTSISFAIGLLNQCARRLGRKILLGVSDFRVKDMRSPEAGSEGGREWSGNEVSVPQGI